MVNGQPWAWNPLHLAHARLFWTQQRRTSDEIILSKIISKESESLSGGHTFFPVAGPFSRRNRAQMNGSNTVNEKAGQQNARLQMVRVCAKNPNPFFRPRAAGGSIHRYGRWNRLAKESGFRLSTALVF